MAEVEGGRREGRGGEGRGREANKPGKLWVDEFVSEDKSNLRPCGFISAARNKLWLGQFGGGEAGHKLTLQLWLDGFVSAVKNKL